jgi:response regulator NasT
MSSYKIVIADDEPLVRDNLKDTVENLGHSVVGETDEWERAIELTRELKPDLVLLDIWFENEPDTQKAPKAGLLAAQELAGDRIAPIVMITAHARADLIEGARDIGVMGYVVKPVKKDQLVAAMELATARFREYVELQEAMAEVERELENTKDQLETRKVIERAKGVLMDTYGLKEADAFRRIQKLSMNSRKSMKEVAEAILLTQGVDANATPQS